MYNTNFVVKYKDIEEELIIKLKDNKDEYNNDDILDVCNKLYRDELVSVFYADDLLDDKIDAGMKYVLEKMLENADFKLLTNQAIISLKKSCTSEEYDKEREINLNTILILTMFSQECFYLFHKCICQQLTLGTVEINLLVELKQCFTEIFIN
jgi:hypothetical protein